MSRRATLTRGQKFLLRLGCLMLAVGILCNEWLLGWIASSDGSIEDPEDLLLIRIFQSGCLCWGALNVAFYRTQLAHKLNLFMVALCLASPLLGELGTRLAIVAGTANQVGVPDEGEDIVDVAHDPILFFGDSFVEGDTEPADRIPEILDTLTADLRSLNIDVLTVHETVRGQAAGHHA